MTVQTTAHEQTAPGPGQWFTGEVFIDTLAETAPPSQLRVSRVTFTPGARTAWHTHPLGQVLHAVTGEGRLYVDGSGLRRLLPGDTATVPPHTRHWHGAAPRRIFTHLAIQEADPETGDEADWFDQVSETDYTTSPEDDR